MVLRLDVGNRRTGPATCVEIAQNELLESEPLHEIVLVSGSGIQGLMVQRLRSVWKGCNMAASLGVHGGMLLSPYAPESLKTRTLESYKQIQILKLSH